jgi:hypothetical protein
LVVIEERMFRGLMMSRDGVKFFVDSFYGDG